MLMKQLEALLKRVEKPSRYIGHEVNAVYKDLSTVQVRYAHAFPDIYEVGVSHLGSHILYGAFNEVPEFYCERVYAPWVDMEAQMLAHNVPLFSLETKTPVAAFDFIGFTLQYELSYTNIIRMLKLGNLPPLKKDRTPEMPLIIAGGPCAYNPEPLADIVDVFLIGEGEKLLIDFAKYYQAHYKSQTRESFMRGLSQIQGVYVPELYTVTYHADGTLASFAPRFEEVPAKVVKRIEQDMDAAYYPDKFIVPFGDAVHNRAVVEIFRGCTKGCRFCQAGMIYRPLREKSTERVEAVVDAILQATGFEEVALSSLSTLDHSEIEPMISRLIEKYQDQKVGISLPSLRLDSLSVDVLQEIQKVRKTGLTFAPEAGTQRLRDVINKGVTDQNIDETLARVFKLGWSRVKLYFMLGLPTETLEDVQGIVDIARRIQRIYREVTQGEKRKPLTLTISTSTFVPKPFTPFQWSPHDGMDLVLEKQQLLKDAFRKSPVQYNYHDAKTSRIEAVFSRGDRRLGKAIVAAEAMGCHFDGWEEHFHYDKWLEALAAEGLDVDFYAHRERGQDEILPWDFIDCGVEKRFLQREWQFAKTGKTTVDCRLNCIGCGVNSGDLGGICK